MTTKHTPGPWHIRRCDDSSSMNMTVISTQDWGPHNNSWFDNEPDTIAIVFHQLLPQVSCGIDDLGDANADYHEVLVGNLGDAVDQARTVIAKAKGQAE